MVNDKQKLKEARRQLRELTKEARYLYNRMLLAKLFIDAGHWQGAKNELIAALDHFDKLKFTKIPGSEKIKVYSHEVRNLHHRPLSDNRIPGWGDPEDLCDADD